MRISSPPQTVLSSRVLALFISWHIHIEFHTTFSVALFFSISRNCPDACITSLALGVSYVFFFYIPLCVFSLSYLVEYCRIIYCSLLFVFVRQCLRRDGRWEGGRGGAAGNKMDHLADG